MTPARIGDILTKKTAKLGVLAILPDAIVTSLFAGADPPRMHLQIYNYATSMPPKKIIIVNMYQSRCHLASKI